MGTLVLFLVNVLPLSVMWAMGLSYVCPLLDFPSGPSGKEPACQCRRCKRCRFYPWVRRISWRRARQPTPVFCLKNPMDRGAWWATIHRVAKSWIRLKRLGTHTHTHTHTHTPFIMLQYIFFYTQLFSIHSCFYTQLFELFFYTQLFEMFCCERMLSFVTCVFCIFCYGYIIFIFHSINVKCHTYWFEYVEPSLQFRLEFYLFMVDVSFNVLLNSNLLIFFENFCIYINQSYWSVFFFFFSCSVLVWIWYQGNAGLIEWACEYFLLFSFLKELEKEWY